MTKQLIENTLNKILYKGKYVKKDAYSHNKTEERCSKCNRLLDLETESKICERCDKKFFKPHREKTEW